ncbi:pranc domain protein [Fusarium flagelliforme]|uniref:Pranc domain protein n=1 Tax=Fusarium flagelliforme TaxID=2675880 RepID=A0A395MIZ1_9HYPO|nr:pranc domain protein [Fusarium flagelliforme]
MAINKGRWGSLPAEIQLEVIRFLPSVGGKYSKLAPVCRAWQSIFEPPNFAEISLTLPRLEDPKSQDILFRKRNLIRYIWFHVEVKEYDCNRCTGEDETLWGLDDVENQFIADAFEKLFTTLSAWEPGGDLILDISVYSPSDNKHWFKYLTFCSDTDSPERLPEHELHDPAHGWTDGRRTKAPANDAIESTFDEIMGEGPFDDEPLEMKWWRSLPLVPVVGVVLLRQQTRRRWKPTALANMFTRFPNMKDLCYEPWREWDDIIEIETNERTQTMIESFASTRLCNLTIFENFNDAYREIYSKRSFPVAAVRVPDPAVSKKLARASLHLTTLSASFMVDASHFFAARRDSWTWDKLTSLALTSGTLTNDARPEDINRMLHNAAEVALQMPKLDAMEIWNGRRGVAMVFRYERSRDRQPAMITVRGTWDLNPSPAVKRAWGRVANETVAVESSLVDPSLIQSHGDAIRELGLLAEVIRPVSLRQILIEHQLRAK